MVPPDRFNPMIGLAAFADVAVISPIKLLYMLLVVPAEATKPVTAADALELDKV